MFKGLADIAGMMKKTKQMQSRMGEIQDHLARQRIRGSAGGGVVSFEVNGKQDVLSCHIEQTLIDNGDRAMIQELVVSALNDAMHRSRQAMADAMQEVAGDLDISGMDQAMNQLGN